jgi:hypothetical protein
MLNRDQSSIQLKNSFRDNSNQNNFSLSQFEIISHVSSLNSLSDQIIRDLWENMEINSNEIKYGTDNSPNQRLNRNLQEINQVFSRINLIYQRFSPISYLNDFDEGLKRILNKFDEEESNRKNNIIKKLKEKALECINEAIKIKNIFDTSFEQNQNEDFIFSESNRKEVFRRASNELLEILNNFCLSFENRVQNAHHCAKNADQLCNHRPSVSIFSDSSENRLIHQSVNRQNDLSNLNSRQQEPNARVANGYEFIFEYCLNVVRDHIQNELNQISLESESNSNEIINAINYSNLNRINLHILHDYYSKHFLIIYRLDEKANQLLQ